MPARVQARSRKKIAIEKKDSQVRIKNVEEYIGKFSSQPCGCEGCNGLGGLGFGEVVKLSSLFAFRGYYCLPSLLLGISTFF